MTADTLPAFMQGYDFFICRWSTWKI